MEHDDIARYVELYDSLKGRYPNNENTNFMLNILKYQLHKNN